MKEKCSNINNIEGRSYVYLFKDQIPSFTAFDICEYINKNGLSFECLGAKKRYVNIYSSSTYNSKTGYKNTTIMLADFLISRLDNDDNKYSNSDIKELKELMIKNIDIFFDITDKEDSIYVIEIV
jgi:hypothetical protein